ncbi:hypothetical protein LXL04_035272 [Taraxacum kok-saghyz]
MIHKPSNSMFSSSSSSSPGFKSFYGAKGWSSRSHVDQYDPYFILSLYPSTAATTLMLSKRTYLEPFGSTIQQSKSIETNGVKMGLDLRTPDVQKKLEKDLWCVKDFRKRPLGDDQI